MDSNLIDYSILRRGLLQRNTNWLEKIRGDEESGRSFDPIFFGIFWDGSCVEAAFRVVVV